MKITLTPSAIPSSRGIPAALMLIVTLGILLAPRVANAQAKHPTLPPQAGEKSFVDNFVSNLKPLTYVPVLGSEVLSFAKGSLSLSSESSGRWFALAKVAKNGDDIVAESSSMRVVVKCSAASGLGLWTRDGFITCNLLPEVVDDQPVNQSRLMISAFWGGVLIQDAIIDVNVVDNDVVVEFDTIGTTVTVRAWELENPSGVYELSWTDVPVDWVWTGTLGLGALGYTDGDSKAPAVSFSQFNLKIIPPTSNRP